MSPADRIERVIVIAAPLRTGGTLLRRSLTATGVVGEIEEYLNPLNLTTDRFGVGGVHVSIRGHLRRLWRRLLGSPTWKRIDSSAFTRRSVRGALVHLGERHTSREGILSVKIS